MEIKEVKDSAFRRYGRVVEQVDFSGLVKALEQMPAPECVVYEPSLDNLEALPVKEELERVVYGEMPVQIGCCSGHNELLNALEYHKSSEINVSADDMILMLGLRQDMEEDFTYDTSRVEVFLVPAGTAVELYATTLHYAPCGVNGAGFRTAVVLPKGTNCPLTESHMRVSGGKAGREDALLTAVNKWLVGHEQGGLEAGCFLGLRGRNLRAGGVL